jgi:DNA-binding transcriptional LysR family regulator
MPDISWNDLRYVLAVGRTRALAPAARRLGVNETTVARRIVRLEQSLGSKLFDRIRGTMIPTHAGHIAVERAEQMEAEIDRLKGLATGADQAVAGTVRITSIPLIVNRLLMPNLEPLYAAHPHLHIEAIAEPRNISITRRDADLALRLARPDREQGILSRRIGNLTYAAYGPSKRLGCALPWITYATGLAALPHVAWINDAIEQEEGNGPSLTVNDSEVALHAVKAGVGKSLLPCAIADREKGIARLSGPLLDRELWLLVHPELRNLARIRTVIAWLDTLVEEFAGSARR